MRRAFAALVVAWSITATSGGEAAAAGIDDCPALIVETFGEYAAIACAKAYCETGGTFDPYATGAAGERGWFQIHPIHGANSSYDPEVNVAYAFKLSRGGRDWSHWSC